MSKGYKILGLAIVSFLFIALFTFRPVSASEEVTLKDTVNKSSYKTIEAVRGDYTEKGAVMNAELTFLRNDGLAIKESEGTFIEYLVTDGQMVKKGDELLSYRIPFDSIAVEEKKLALELNQKSYEAELMRRETEIADNRNSLMMKDHTTIEAQILNLRITKLEIGYDQFKYQGEKNIEAMNETIEEMKLSSEIKYIYAPYDGVVYNLDERLIEDQSINPYMELIRIYDIQSAVLYAQEVGANKLWYNQEVSVSMVSNRQENKGITYPGKVISMDSVLDNKANTGMIFIKLDDESLYSNISKANITADAVHVHDVFVLPLKAVNFNNEERYIYYLDETGDIHKQYITGRNNGVDMWVYEGLTEGQKIIVD